MSPELQLLVELCARTFPRARGKLTELAIADWDLFLRLARFHRVQGLAWKAISADEIQLPAVVSEALAADATVIAATNLRIAVECRALLSDFTQGRVPLLLLKGLPLGKLAYGSTSLKSAVDIDLVIPIRDLAAAARLLQDRGYVLTVPERTTATLPHWHRIRKESLWVAPSFGLQVDLHTRVADNARMVPTIGVHSPRRLVDVGNGLSLPTLGPTETFAYLAVHGASSAWFRLKWICDFAALLADKSPNELDELYRQSLRLGAGRAPAQALLLADRLFGTLANSPALQAELKADRMNRLLYRAALKQLAGRSEPIEPTSRPLGTLRIHWTQFLLMPGLRFKGSELLRQARSVLA